MPESEYEALRADVAACGVLVPIEITAKNVVLDGRLRLRAARELGFKSVPVRVVDANDQFEYMVKAAVLRRQLSQSQRAALVVELDEYRRAREEARKRSRANLHQTAEVATLPPRGERTRDIAARFASVSPRTVQDAITVKEADPELFEAVKQGKMPVQRAVKQVRREQKHAALRPPPPLPEGPFEIVLADPPYRLGSPGSDRAPENHYPTMPLEEIAALHVPAADDALLFLWAVNSLLPEALSVMAAWGFEFRAQLVWVKDRLGLGQWTRNRHELLLLGRRGGYPLPDEPDRPDSVIEAPRRRHSEKPDDAYARIERMYPHASRLELFARKARPGWTAWGNEAL